MPFSSRIFVGRFVNREIPVTRLDWTDIEAAGPVFQTIRQDNKAEEQEDSRKRADSQWDQYVATPAARRVGRRSPFADTAGDHAKDIRPMLTSTRWQPRLSRYYVWRYRSGWFTTILCSCHSGCS